MLLKTASLMPIAEKIICHQATEPAGTYELAPQTTGTFVCRQCGLGLFHSTAHFVSGCGWPSFDEAMPEAVATKLDPDCHRTEIHCARCQCHLGHVFHGEKLTPKNIRHCVNSHSIDFVPVENMADTEELICAAGCFWGVEYYFKKLKGVLKTEVGYTGGSVNNPDYKMVCGGNTGHLEAIRVLYDPNQLNYEQLVKYFFEIHDPTQTDGQGPDLGQQYLSAIFYYDEKQFEIAQKLISLLQKQGLKVVTQLLPVKSFWPAEEYHQDYYHKTGKAPYCHHYVKRFT